jgi:hypothetical protein
VITGRPLRPRSRPWWLALCALTVFGLRALVPTGYMLAATDGHLRLVICPAGIQRAHDMTASGMTAMEHGASMHHAGHEATGAEHCPFALSGGASLLAASQEPTEPYFALLRPVPPPVIHSFSAAPPPRYHAPRGPPSLA